MKTRVLAAIGTFAAAGVATFAVTPVDLGQATTRIETHERIK